jgi:hypothetical protein
MCVVLRLTRDTSFGITSAIRDRHDLASDALRPDDVTDAWLRARGLDGALQILAPQHLLATIREQPNVIRWILVASELIVGSSMALQATDDNGRIEPST